MAYEDWYREPKYKLSTTAPKSYWKSWYDFEDYGGASSYSSSWVTVRKSPEEANKIACEDALRTIGRSANAIINSNVDQERRLSVKFSNGEDVNRIGNDVIYISPDKILSEAEKEGRDTAIDATCGQVMLIAQLKRNVDVDTYVTFVDSRDHEVRSLWSAIETAVARTDVLTDWQGFKPYFDTYSRYSTDANSTAIKRELSANNGAEGKPTSSKAFIKGLSWNLYHSHDPVKIPPVYNDGKLILAEGLANVRTCKDRWELCERVVEEARRLYDLDYEEKKNKEPGDDEFNPALDDLLGLIKGDVSPAKPELKKNGASKFEGIDEALFGLKAISNEKCKPAGEIDSISGDKSSELKDTVSAPEVTGNDNSVKGAAPAWMPIDKDPYYTKAFPPERIQKMDRMAAALQDVFSFKTKETSRRVYGYNSGSLHNRSLYKAGMDLDTVFFRKSKVESDKLAICILLDQSGSMSGATTKGSDRITDAAAVSYVLAKLCKMVRGIDLSIIGFSAQERSAEYRVRSTGSYNDELNLRMIYDQTDDKASLLDILQAKAHANNTDGFALWHAAKHLSDNRDGYKRKIVIVVSDGQPNASGYGGDKAFEHVNACRNDVRGRFGVETYAIGVADAYPQVTGNKMYGKGNNIIIKDVNSSLGYISRFMSQLAETNV
jgi:hypothetical protein